MPSLVSMKIVLLSVLASLVIGGAVGATFTHTSTIQCGNATGNATPSIATRMPTTGNPRY